MPFATICTEKPASLELRTAARSSRHPLRRSFRVPARDGELQG